MTTQSKFLPRLDATTLLLWMLLPNMAIAQFSPGARSAGDPYLPAIGNGGYDVQHYDLTINYNPVANTMVSRADITIRATQGLSEFSLDLRGFPGATALIDGVAAGVTREPDKLIVTPTFGIETDRVFHRCELLRHARLDPGPRRDVRRLGANSQRRLRGEHADGGHGLVPEQ